MAIDVTCPRCGETDDLEGSPDGDTIRIRCGSCGATWDRGASPSCPTCGGDDLQEVPLAILERGRGTQLSVVGIRTIRCCRTCDRPTIERWQRNRPNPLMPDELPTIGRRSRPE